MHVHIENTCTLEFLSPVYKTIHNLESPSEAVVYSTTQKYWLEIDDTRLYQHLIMKVFVKAGSLSLAFGAQLKKKDGICVSIRIFKVNLIF